MKVNPRLSLGLVVVVASMVTLFTVPRDYFVAATFLATGCMLAASFASGALKRPVTINYRSLAIGTGTALLLYGVFVAGAWAITALQPFGINSANEASIYSLINSHSNPLYVQVAVLLFDAAGYESYFRGVIQQRLKARLGVANIPVVALFDAALHILTLNVLWFATTFVTDVVWGLTYYFGKGKQASFTSHLLWDIGIFIIRPVG